MTLGSCRVPVGFTRGRQGCAYRECGFYGLGVVHQAASLVRVFLRSDFSIWKVALILRIAAALWGPQALALNIFWT